ncbi:hypothetical protein CBM2599_B50397 [Cupriavidus taiwanensis]|nr:hypothetical protein CBM2600_B10593 [Cupriavidus taiwanensis]SOY96465.1 hypothetical protein CBM2599_B50397 [Cupriavidus taiwanensis]
MTAERFLQAEELDHRCTLFETSAHDFFLALAFLACLDDLSDFFLGYDNQPVTVTHDDVAMAYNNAAHRYGDIHLAWLEFVRTLDTEAAAENREAHLDNRARVTDSAIDDQASDTNLFGSERQDVAPWTCIDEPFGVNDEYVARLRLGEGVMNHQVVARPDVDGQRRTNHAHARVKRSNTRVDCTALALSFMDGGSTEAIQGFELRLVDVCHGKLQ